MSVSLNIFVYLNYLLSGKNLLKFNNYFWNANFYSECHVLEFFLSDCLFSDNIEKKLNPIFNATCFISSWSLFCHWHKNKIHRRQRVTLPGSLLTKFNINKSPVSNCTGCDRIMSHILSGNGVCIWLMSYY